MRKKILLGTVLCATLFQTIQPSIAQEISLPDITALPSVLNPPDSFKEQITQNSVLSHIQQTGAKIYPLENLYGLRSFVAQNGDKILPFFLTPDGKAMISGVIMNMSPEMMLKLDGKAIEHIPSIHGLEGLFVRTGERFQVFYITPDRKKVIPGLMWDEEGRNITQAQIAPLIGINAPNSISTLPSTSKLPMKESASVDATLNNPSSCSSTIPTGQSTSTSKNEESEEALPLWHTSSVTESSMNIFTIPSDEPSKAVFALLNQTYGGIYGKEDTPELLMFIDPVCHFSKQALTLLDPYVKAGRLHLVIVPIAVLDQANHGKSSQQAKRLLSSPVDQMAQTWMTPTINTSLTSDAEQKFSVNQQMIEGLHLNGTPIFFWQRPNKSFRRFEGLPDSIEALVNQVEKGK